MWFVRGPKMRQNYIFCSAENIRRPSVINMKFSPGTFCCSELRRFLCGKVQQGTLSTTGWAFHDASNDVKPLKTEVAT
eukprot:JP436714.1.p2 GENE.JP436714.1~~JP436714.1.p2  ORF type:complete len:78 (+),score=8.71 JP436714.1:436-669(+)